MRMWMVDPRYLCRQHLLGEHREMHTIIGIMRNNSSMTGYKNNKLIDTESVISRHDELAEEMITRNYNHKSPMDNRHQAIQDYYNTHIDSFTSVDVEVSIDELHRRCPRCSARIAYFLEHPNHERYFPYE